MSRKFGARPPPGSEWQMGKTAASISFINNAETFMRICQDARKIEVLREMVQKVKDGELMLQDWLTAEEYLNQYIPKV